MANDCWYDMRVWAKDKGAIERFVNILRYKDSEYFIYRVFDVEENSDITAEGDGWYSLSLLGSVAWSAQRWFDDEEDKEDVYEATGAHYTTITQLTKALGIAIEVYTEEPGMMFAEHYAAIDGKVVCDEDCFYGDCFFDDLESFENFLIDFYEPMRQVLSDEDFAVLYKEVAEGLGKYGGLSCEIGGFEWDWTHTPKEMMKGDVSQPFQTFEVRC